MLKKTVQHDNDRSKILEEFGIKIIRFQNRDIIENIEEVKDRILTELSKE